MLCAASRCYVQVVHDRSRCIFGAERFTPLKQGLQATYTWASGTDLPARLQSHQEFQAEILEPGTFHIAVQFSSYYEQLHTQCTFVWYYTSQ